MKQVMNMKRSTDMKRSMNLIDAMAKSLLIATFWLPAAALAPANVPLTGTMAAPGAGAPAAGTAATAAPATPVTVTTAPPVKPAPAPASTPVVTAAHIGNASRRERVCQYGYISVVAVFLKITRRYTQKNITN